MKALAEINDAVEFLAKHGARRDSGVWLSRDYEILSADPIKAARRLRSMLIEKSHRDKDGGLRKQTRA